jgi:hypothetical protein
MLQFETAKIAWILSAVLGLSACSQPASDNEGNGPVGVEKNNEWGNEQAIEILDLPSNMNSMEPQVFSNEQYLFFNNGNGDGQQMDLFYATKITDTKYQYRGQLSGVNTTTDIEGTAAIDANFNFYFVSTRVYGVNYDSVFGGTFNTNGSITGIVEKGQNITDANPGDITMGIDVTVDGNWMFLSRAHFTDYTKPPVTADIDLAYKSNGVWVRAPTNQFQKINTTQYLEYATAMSNDGLELYFTRAYDATVADSLKIMVSKRKNASDIWGMPQEIAAIQGNVTEAPCLSANERYLYYHKQDSNGRSRIYRVGR